MMKKAAYICLTIAFTLVSAEARPPFGGTIFVSRNIITSEDPTAFKSLTPAGRGERRMFDRRSGRWGRLNARLFTTKFDDGQTMEVHVNPEFEPEEAFEQAKKYLTVIGQMPFALRKDVKTVTIHKGRKPFGGGNRNLLIHTGMGEGYIRGGILAETFYHEAAHTSLDKYHARNKDWLAAQKKDPEFISGYAKHHPGREDVAETYLLYFALRYRPGRIDNKLKETLKKTIPNRIAYFDSLKLNMHPVVKRKGQVGTRPAGRDVKPAPRHRPVRPEVALKRELDKVKLTNAALPHVFQKLRDDFNVNISVRWREVKSAGVGRDKTVTLSLVDASLEKILKRVLEEVAPGKLGFEVKEGALVISSRQKPDTR